MQPEFDLLAKCLWRRRGIDVRDRLRGCEIPLRTSEFALLVLLLWRREDRISSLAVGDRLGKRAGGGL